MRHHETSDLPRMARGVAQWPALDLLLTRRVGLPLANELSQRLSAQKRAVADQRWRDLQCAFTASDCK